MPPRTSFSEANVAAQVNKFNKTYIQGGPQGLSLLGFLCGIATCAVGTMGVITEILDAEIITAPFDFVLHLYLVCLGFTCVLLECDAEQVNNLPVLRAFAVHLNKLHKFVNVYAKFLSKLAGRGCFYLFIGTFCITECILCPLFLVGAANGFVGVLLLMLSIGFKPDMSYENLQRVGSNISRATRGSAAERATSTA